jgi:hypothetical protein
LKKNTNLLLLSEKQTTFATGKQKQERKCHTLWQAQLELLNALNSIQTEAEFNEFRNLMANFFAQKAGRAIDALWDNGTINEQTVEEWGKEHMRTPYRYAAHRSWHQLPASDTSCKKSVSQDMD